MRLNILFRLIAEAASFGNDFLYVFGRRKHLHSFLYRNTIFTPFVYFFIFFLVYFKDTLAAYDIQLRTANDGSIMH